MVLLWLSYHNFPKYYLFDIHSVGVKIMKISCNKSKNVTFYIFLLVSIAFSAITKEVTSSNNHAKENSRADLKIVSPLSAQELWEKLHIGKLPAGVTNFTVEFKTGCNYPEAAGAYSDMEVLNGIKADDGIIMTSGKAEIAKGPNSSTSAGFDQDGGDFTTPGNGDADLEALVPNYKSYCACLLTLKFTTDTSIHGLTFDFIFGTDEYWYYVGSDYNDIFATFLDGKNICFDHDNNLINVNNNFFKICNTDIPDGATNIPKPHPTNSKLNLEYDGFTPLLRTSDTLTPGDHTLKFAICDMGDQILDAGVFLSNFKFEYSQKGTTPVTISILPEQMWSIFEDAKSGEHVGNIGLNTSDPSAVAVTIINNVTEFKLDPSTPFGITVADGASFDASKKDSYILTIVASAGSGQTATSCTTNVLVIIKGITDIINNNNMSNVLAAPIVSGSNLVINGLVTGTFNISITNLKGQEVLKIDNSSNAIIDISTIATGIYFVSTFLKDRKFLSKIYIDQ